MSQITQFHLVDGLTSGFDCRSQILDKLGQQKPLRSQLSYWWTMSIRQSLTGKQTCQQGIRKSITKMFLSSDRNDARMTRKKHVRQTQQIAQNVYCMMRRFFLTTILPESPTDGRDAPEGRKAIPVSLSTRRKKTR